MSKKKIVKNLTFSTYLIVLGAVLIFVSVAITAFTFYPIFILETGYFAKNLSSSKDPEPVISASTDFGIVVPKIGANSAVVAEVDPYNEAEYQAELAKGIAHAKGTSLPGQGGNIFLFSHSSANFFEARKYNSQFYLLSKLETGDDITLYYQGNEFKYKVYDKKIVDPSALEYLGGERKKQTLTLMTCTPAGTTLKRLLILSERYQ